VEPPLLLDPSLVASATHGVAFQMGIYIEISTRPATLVIDRCGVLRYARRVTSFSNRPAPEEVLRIATGNVPPAPPERR